MSGPLRRLPAAQLDALLDGDWATSGPFRLNERLTADDLRASVLLVNVRRMLEAVTEVGGAPVTEGGRFAPQFVELLVERLWWGITGDRELLPGDPEPESERKVRPLGLSRTALELAGLLERAGDRLVVTPTGGKLLKRARGGELYARLFRVYFRELDHSQLDGEPAIPHAWRHVPYALWVLGQFDDGWWEPGPLLSRLVPHDVLAAENRRLDALRERSERIVPTVEELLLMRLVEPLQDFALLASRPAERGERGYPIPRYRRGQMYHRVLRFDFAEALDT